MRRRLFTLWPTVCGVLCVGTGLAYGCTATIYLYRNGRPELYVESVPLLGWASAMFAVLAIASLLWEAKRIRMADDRVRNGLCPSCGYDLRASPGRCPECGDELGDHAAILPDQAHEEVCGDVAD